MQTSSLSHLKNELQSLPPAEIADIMVRLIKYKQENKELLHYILFESNNENAYIKNLKEEMDEMFLEVNTASMHWAKKTIRKILRWLTKHGRYSGLATTQIELLLHFCYNMYALPLNFNESMAMQNLYESQVKKIKKLTLSLHEDLQFDYKERVDNL